MKELRLASISSMEAGNVFLPYVRAALQRALCCAASQDAGHLPTVATTTPRLNDILGHREQRYVGAQLTFHYDRKQIITGAERRG